MDLGHGDVVLGLGRLELILGDEVCRRRASLAGRRSSCRAGVGLGTG
ncbi:MAG: hypothetical protein MZV64_13180 [Ignavibacteriales bacterium]|nr:hypothetical protein [Ignavibacteriales bacterium]